MSKNVERELAVAVTQEIIEDLSDLLAPTAVEAVGEVIEEHVARLLHMAAETAAEGFVAAAKKGAAAAKAQAEESSEEEEEEDSCDDCPMAPEVCGMVEAALRGIFGSLPNPPSKAAKSVSKPSATSGVRVTIKTTTAPKASAKTAAKGSPAEAPKETAPKNAATEKVAPKAKHPHIRVVKMPAGELGAILSLLMGIPLSRATKSKAKGKTSTTAGKKSGK